MYAHNKIVKTDSTFTMKKIYATQALLPEGWVNNVLVNIGTDGCIESVEQAIDLAATANQSETQIVSTLLPAPVNVHSHAFQRAMAGLTEKRGQDPSDSFWTWRRLMYTFLDRLTPDQIEAITAFVQMEMLEAGYATNVEFHYIHHQPGGAEYSNLAELSERIVAATHTSGIGLTLIPVHYQYGGCDQRPLTSGQQRFGNDLDRFERLWMQAKTALATLPLDSRMGISAHSLRAVDRNCFSSLRSLDSHAPFHMHLAEQKKEVTEVEQAWGARPVEWLLDNVNVNDSWCLIHCTQMLPHETNRLAKSGAVAGLCPITESSLGDGIFDGINYVADDGHLAIGSDSNIRISLSEELRTLDYTQRLRDNSRAAFANEHYSTGRRLLEAVTKGGAQAAGRKTGRIEVGQVADLMSLDGTHPDLEGVNGDTTLDIFIFAGDDRMINHVWSAGRHRVVEGMHVDRDVIVQRYRDVMKTLREDI